MEDGLLRERTDDCDDASEFRSSIDDACGASYGPVLARPLWLRLLFLLCACTGCCGIYYGYNIVGSTAPALQEPPFNLDAEDIGAIAAAYSLPNVAVPLVGGVVVDRIGVCRAALLFGSIVTAGSVGLWAAVAHPATPSVRRPAPFLGAVPSAPRHRATAGAPRAHVRVDGRLWRRRRVADGPGPRVALPRGTVGPATRRGRR